MVAFRYHAIIDHEEIYRSNSIVSLKKQMAEYMELFGEPLNAEIITGIKAPMIIQQYDGLSHSWRICKMRYFDGRPHYINWLDSNGKGPKNI